MLLNLSCSVIFLFFNFLKADEDIECGVIYNNNNNNHGSKKGSNLQNVNIQIN